MPSQADVRRRIRSALILRATGDWPRRPYPGQRYTHGWKPTAFGRVVEKVKDMTDKDLIETYHDPEFDDPKSETYSDDFRLAVVREIGERAGSGDTFKAWQARERRVLANQRRRLAARSKSDNDRYARMDALIEQGYSPEHAWEQVTGGSLAKDRAWAIVGRRKGESYERALRRGYRDAIDAQVAETENTVIGYFLSHEGERALARARAEAKRNGKTFRFSPHDLWSMPETQAMAWASDELKDFWESHGGRLTFAAWRGQVER